MILKRCLFLALAFTFSVCWHGAAAFDPASYPRHVTLASVGADIYWRFDNAASPTVITFGIVAPTTAGWVGLGIGEPNSGNMPGSDMMIATVDAATGALTVGDYFSTDFVTPTKDCGSQDWTGVSGAIVGNVTMIEVSRPLIATNLFEDRSIEDTLNPIHMLFAYGSSRTLAYHGVSQRALFTAYLFSTADPYADLQADATLQRVAWTMANYTVPAAGTTYWNTPCYRSPPTAKGQTPFIVGFAALITSLTPGLVHHMVVQAFTDAQCATYPVDIWAVASNPVPFVMPKDIGLSMQYAAYSVQIHYNNPSRLSGLVDNSGVTIFYTYSPRANSAGVLQLADPGVRTTQILVSGLNTAQYGCPASCTQLWGGSGITIFGELLHMHQVGASMSTTFKYPDGRKYTRQVEYFSFHNQQNVLVPRTTVPPGSVSKTTCNYKVPDGTSTVRFGLASTDEMCIHFVYYYPIQPSVQGVACGLDICGGSLDTFSKVPSLNRTFGVMPTVTAAPTASPSSSTSSAAIVIAVFGFTLTVAAVGVAGYRYRERRAKVAVVELRDGPSVMVDGPAPTATPAAATT